VSDYLLFAFLGLGSGAVYGLLAQGVVLEYRSSGFVNFAHGAMAMFVAYVFSELRLTGELFFPVVGIPDRVALTSGPMSNELAIPISLLYAALLGALVYFVVFRPLRTAPALAKVVASVGLLLTLQAIVVLKFGSLTRTVGPILPTDPMTIGDITFPRDRLYLAGVLLVVTAALASLYRFTRFGMATRAAAESERAALLLGYSPDRIALVNWVLATLVAGLAGILIAPITTLAPQTYTLFIVPALGAALLGRFTSFWLTAIGGLLIGILGSELTKLQSEFAWLPRSGLQSALPFVLILAVMFTLGKTVPTRGAVATQPQPRPGNPRHPLRTALIAASLTIAALYVLQGGWRLALIQSMVTAVVLLSIVLVTGYVGQISFAQASFAGVSGFVLTHVTTDLGIPFPLSLIVSALAAVPIGFAVGLPALRVRGVNLAVITLAAAWVMEELVFKLDEFTGGVAGARAIAPSIFGIDLSIAGTGPDDFPRAEFGIVVAVVLALCCIGMAYLRRSVFGRRMLAVRSNESAAAALGVNVPGTKLWAFSLSAFIAGVGGGLIAYQRQVLSFDSFGVFVGLVFVTVAYLGGIGMITGALIGGALATGGLFPVALDRIIGLGEYELLFVGVIVIFSAIRHPDGIATGFGRRRRQTSEADVDAIHDQESASRSPIPAQSSKPAS
jgi:ABC-type branched-subunit amino acid transport system permease subunit